MKFKRLNESAETVSVWFPYNGDYVHVDFSLADFASEIEEFLYDKHIINNDMTEQEKILATIRYTYDEPDANWPAYLTPEQLEEINSMSLYDFIYKYEVLDTDVRDIWCDKDDFTDNMLDSGLDLAEYVDYDVYDFSNDPWNGSGLSVRDFVDPKYFR